MTMRLRFASPLLLVALAACQATVVPRPGAVSVPPRDPRCTVEFWSVAERPSRPLDELADIKVLVSPAAPNPYALRELMRDKACAVGADAIVDLHEEVGPTETRLVGTAVRYRPQ